MCSTSYKLKAWQGIASTTGSKACTLGPAILSRSFQGNTDKERRLPNGAGTPWLTHKESSFHLHREYGVVTTKLKPEATETRGEQHLQCGQLSAEIQRFLFRNEHRFVWGSFSSQCWNQPVHEQAAIHASSFETAEPGHGVTFQGCPAYNIKFKTRVLISADQDIFKTSASFGAVPRNHNYFWGGETQIY